LLPEFPSIKKLAIHKAGWKVKIEISDLYRNVISKLINEYLEADTKEFK
jgi:hypothetical protein